MAKPFRSKLVVDNADGIRKDEWVNGYYVASSNVEWVAWAASAPLMLVKYKDNDVIYGYIGVSRQRAVAAALADSVGSYIARNIKGKFQPVQIK